MKLAIALLGLSVALMLVMIFLTVQQEVSLHSLKSLKLRHTAEFQDKEDSIVIMKNKVNGLKTELESARSKVDELNKQKEELEKSKKEFGANLETCTKDKEAAVKKKTELADAITELKTSHKTAEDTTKEEIKTLKQQISDRDKAICAFVDTSKEEAKKLCDVSETPK